MSWLGTYGFEVSLGNLGGHPAGRRVYPPHCRKRSVLQICVRVISVEVGGWRHGWGFWGKTACSPSGN